MSDLEQENQQLREDLLRERIARETGTIPSMLAGADEAAMRQSAQDALAWRSTPAPQQTNTGAVSYNSAPATSGSVKGVNQFSRETLAALPPETVTAAWTAGRLAGLGAPAPQPRRNGEAHRNAAP
jgi:hypothetical protein